MIKWRWMFAAVALLWPLAAGAQQPLLSMGYSGVGIGSDLLKVIERSGLWRKHGIEVRTIYLSSGSLMAQTLSSGDIGIAGFDTPAMLNLALAGHSLKIVAVPINRIEPMFVVRSNIKTPADLKGKKITISRFGSGSDIISRAALLEDRSRQGRELLSVGQYADARGGIDRRPHGRGLGQFHRRSQDRRHRLLPCAGGLI